MVAGRRCTPAPLRSDDASQVSVTVPCPGAVGSTPDQDWMSALRRSTRRGVDEAGAATAAADRGET